MKKITVNASTAYDVIIGKGLLDGTGELCLSALGSPCNVCILSDDRVAPLYLDRVRCSLNESGFDTVEFIIPNGEASKNTAQLVSLVEFMAQARLTRSDAVVALGGGVVGDLGGFAASVYLRGIRFVQIPTTLLAAVDSSVGGKTAVDLVAGKNLMGAFHQPSLVICDPSTLDTLTPEILSDGCAEVIKYGVIGNRPFFNSLKLGIKNNVEDVIAECVQSKADIVFEDEFDRGSRQILNLGHTVGHAVELCSNLTISHGSAVSIGMVIVMRAACKMGLCQDSELFELISLLESQGLPTKCPFGARELADVAIGDKKRSADVINIVIPYSIGDSKLYPLPISKLCDFIAKGLDV